MAVCKIEIARVWSMLLKPIAPSQPVSYFKNYIAYQQQNSQQKQPVSDFAPVLANAIRVVK